MGTAPDLDEPATRGGDRLVLVAAILGSFVAFLDMSVVNVALPAIRRSLGGGTSAQQWIVDAYLLTLSALMLIAGSLSDLLGRRRVFAAGLAGFGAASLLCAFAPGVTFLIVARALQGAAGALLVPSSLALIVSRFKGDAQGRAIGTWTAWTGIAFVIGPLLGGALVDAGAHGGSAEAPSMSWRWVFGINVAPIVATLLVLARLPSDRQRQRGRSVDGWGAALCAAGLGGLTFALIEQPRAATGWAAPSTALPLVTGAAALGAFILRERLARDPMLDFALFRSRSFAAGNAATAAIYAGLSAATFLLALHLQQVVGYRAIAAGAALLPVTLILFLLSPRFGRWSARRGPRWFMTAGPIVAGVGLWLLSRMGSHPRYALGVLPGVIVFGLGLASTVAPLTAAVLGGVDERHAGVASAVNNAVSRVAGLLAIAAVGARPFQPALSSMAALLCVGGLISAAAIRNPGSPPP
ncbi:MAG TPA: MFS transporter [Polyangia bacterium]|nr:MFS transporter [Polyangia bacterium]